jgi:uncharacterized protein YeaO (DUF488 family)
LAAGLSKQRARLDEWCKEIAPSTTVLAGLLVKR